MSDRRKRNRGHDRKSQKTDLDEEGTAEEPAIDESSPVIQMFRSFQQQLDGKHDKHERMVKLSRDITIESKRTIFMLHRFKDITTSASLLEQAETKLVELEESKFKQVARELQGTDPFMFLRAYTAGLQEYIEALTFLFYLKTSHLITLEDVQKRLTFTDTPSEDNSQSEDSSQAPTETDSTTDQSKPSDSEPTDQSKPSNSEPLKVFVPTSEYFLGIADLTGEMMRRAIHSVGDGDLSRPFEICTFLQEMESAFSSLTNCNREVNRKLTVLRQSLRKVENACYTLRVRGSEIPTHMLVDVLSKSGTASQFIEEQGVDED